MVPITSKITKPARGAPNLADATRVRDKVSDVRGTAADLAESAKESFRNAPATAKIGHRPSTQSPRFSFYTGTFPVNAVSPLLLLYQYVVFAF